MRSDSNRIQAVIFDFGRVISSQKPPALFRAYEEKLGLARNAINPIMFDSRAWQEALIGKKTAEEFWYAIGPALGLKTPGRTTPTFQKHGRRIKIFWAMTYH